MSKKYNISFKDFCININMQELLELWDYEKNTETPDKIGSKSNKKIWFKCPRGIHESTEIPLYNITRYAEEGKVYPVCSKCNSIGQYIIDVYGQDYFNKIVSDKNEKFLFEIPRGSKKNRIWLRCANDETHPDYDLLTGNFSNSHNCPYCAGKRVCHTNSLGYKFPEVLNRWSDKNSKTPYEYTHGSGEEVWWKCESGKHEDYKRMISRSITYNFGCPKCGKENQRYPSGPDSAAWRGGVTPKLNALRKSKAYSDWRKAVFEHDSYTCQCCGKIGGRLNVHHIYDYVSYPDLRLDPSNGITLCTKCHDSTVSGSFHNLYGTHYKTPEELDEYINTKRKELGINIPFDIYEYIESQQFNNFAENNWIFNKLGKIYEAKSSFNNIELKIKHTSVIPNYGIA